MWVSLGFYTVYVCPVPLGRGEFHMNTIHAFPQSVLTAITLVGGGTGDGGARAWAKCEAELLLCLLAITTLSGVGLDPKLMEQNP